MFRKIHSNRDPRDTLYSELKKEFSVYFEKCRDFGTRTVHKHPGTIFGLMIFLLSASVVASIAFHTIFFQSGKENKITHPVVKPLDNGFNQILAAGTALKQTIRLRRQVDSITAKKALTKSDSITLVRDLDSLQHIRLTLPH